MILILTLRINGNIRNIHNISEERKLDSGSAVGRLPNLVGQDQIVINQKATKHGYRYY